MNNFYHYDQNNSGGSFYIDKDVCENVYIEANNANDANEIAQEKGIYFDGCAEGRDCNCCGDRWSEAWEGSAIENHEKLIERLFLDSQYHFTKKDPIAIIHRINGFRYTYHLKGGVSSNNPDEPYFISLTDWINTL